MDWCSSQGHWCKQLKYCSITVLDSSLLASLASPELPEHTDLTWLEGVIAKKSTQRWYPSQSLKAEGSKVAILMYTAFAIHIIYKSGLYQCWRLGTILQFFPPSSLSGFLLLAKSYLDPQTVRYCRQSLSTTEWTVHSFKPDTSVRSRHAMQIKRQLADMNRPFYSQAAHDSCKTCMIRKHLELVCSGFVDCWLQDLFQIVWPHDHAAFALDVSLLAIMLCIFILKFQGFLFHEESL